MSVRSFSFDDVMLFINFSNACAKNDVHYIEIACEKMYKRGFKPEDIQYFVEHDYFRIYENFFVNKKKSAVPDKKYILDRKFAAQAPCFSYGVSGAVAGFH